MVNFFFLFFLQCALLLKDNDQILDSLTWLLTLDEMENSMVIKSHAVQVLKNNHQQG